MNKKIFDIVIIGGGINGMGIAADAAGRGLSVCLLEQNDFASGTSSASTKLIHGGLRYLEHYHFRLVRESLLEREVLLAKAPHLITPMQFVIPQQKNSRPRWMMSLGLWFYDHLGGSISLPKSRSIFFKNNPLAGPLKETEYGFVYSDCWVDDARLVIANALAARDFGAELFSRHSVVSAERSADTWNISALHSDETVQFQAKVLVNATGPWVNYFLEKIEHPKRYHVILVQGSHIIVPRLYEGEQAYLLQNNDERVIFMIPYSDRFTLIGTTDVGFTGDPSNAAITSAEIQYLCDAANRFLREPIHASDVVSTYSGVRPLQDDEIETLSQASRDYTLDLNSDEGLAPLLNIYGGKITTYRRLAEKSLELLQPFFPGMKPAWTSSSKLPGGDLCGYSFDLFLLFVREKFPSLPSDLLTRLCKQYGSLIFKVLPSDASLGLDFGHGLFQVEVDYLRDFEWAMTAEDILWRRTKLGLVFSQIQVQKLSKYLNNAGPA